MTPYVSTITGNLGLCVFLSVCFPPLLFSSPPSASLALSLSFPALMSGAHCAESRVGVGSVPLALESCDRVKASFSLVCVPLQHRPFQSLSGIYYSRKGRGKRSEMKRQSYGRGGWGGGGGGRGGTRQKGKKKNS